MKIQLLCIGDLKFKGLKEIEQVYVEKIKFFTTFEIRVLKDIKSEDDSLKKKKEGELMLESLDKRDYVIALDQYGKKMNSIEFSKYLSDKMMNHPHRIVFLIGGHAGIPEIMNEHIDLKLSFSDMTFGHDIFRIIFLEQLYRTFTIIKKIKYHR
jgi:23S rRNA (pseudouridine1915-N3)-methyltransferase